MDRCPVTSRQANYHYGHKRICAWIEVFRWPPAFRVGELLSHLLWNFAQPTFRCSSLPLWLAHSRASICHPEIKSETALSAVCGNFFDGNNVDKHVDIWSASINHSIADIETDLRQLSGRAHMYFMLIIAVQTFKENEMICAYPGWECWDVSSSSNSDLGMGWLGLTAWSKGMGRGWIRYFWDVCFMTSSVLWNVFRVVLGAFSACS